MEAVIQSAVADESRSPGAVIRAISTCSRPENGPFSGAKTRRQPPLRRATSRSPETVRASIAAAPAAAASRPASSRNSDRCRFVIQRSKADLSADPNLAARGGVDDGRAGRSPHINQTVIRPEGARLICSTPG